MTAKRILIIPHPDRTVSIDCDQIDRPIFLPGEAVGSVPVRDSSGWIALPPGPDGYVLSSGGAGVAAGWVDPATLAGGGGGGAPDSLVRGSLTVLQAVAASGLATGDSMLEFYSSDGYLAASIYDRYGTTFYDSPNSYVQFRSLWYGFTSFGVQDFSGISGVGFAANIDSCSMFKPVGFGASFNERFSYLGGRKATLSPSDASKIIDWERYNYIHAIPSDTCAIATALVSLRGTSGPLAGQCRTAELRASFRNDGGTLSIVHTATLYDYDETSDAARAAFDVTDNRIVLRGYGDSASDIEFRSTVQWLWS